MNPPEMRIPLSSPDITETEIEAVLKVLRTSRLSLGPKLIEFEDAMSAYTGATYAAAVSSGTAGLDLALKALGIGEGDEVIVPAFTFVAAANVILYQQAIPVFVDIDPITLNLDPVCVKQAITSKTRALMIVHTFGVPANLDALLELAHAHHLYVIEDACEALGAEYRGKKLGTLGDIGVFSFYPNKPITTGEGGVVVSNDSQVISTIKALRNQGRTQQDDWLHHSLLGYNYRLPEINCALGVVQLGRLDGILKRRDALARCYTELLRELCPDVISPTLDIPHGRISWFAFVLKLPARFNRTSRDLVIQQMASLGIGTRAYFPPITDMPLYANYPRGDLKVTDSVSGRTLALPFFNHIREDEMREVCRSLAHVTAVLPKT